ncbi:type III-B CRISPR module RAMP protein Cmr1 [Wukongibacter sp. M2B1]|uniref:type III-B CRISPR module RAMP protein Cmr1 n=1 Tax=Wukongibacter sp. M2B1 TaxID=3088895 RepID=UPI003D7B41E6
MKQIKITCKLITPLFMYGTSKQPEIRASSLKGLLRYWWRVFNSYKHESTLREEENKIFGSTGNGSPVKIRINYAPKSIRKYNRRSNNNLGKGLSYLFHFLKVGEKEYLVEGTEFEIVFIYDDEKDNIKQYLDALYYLQIFGGMGSRSRRGAGNFIITGVSGLDENNFTYTRKLILNSYSLEEIYAQKEFENAVEVYKANGEYKEWKEALGYIGGTYKDIREVKEHNVYKKGFTSKSKSVFGLPIKGINSKTRMESPLIFKAVKLRDKYIPVIVKMKGNPLLNEQEYIRHDQNLIDIFLKDFNRIKWGD